MSESESSPARPILVAVFGAGLALGGGGGYTAGTVGGSDVQVRGLAVEDVYDAPRAVHIGEVGVTPPYLVPCAETGVDAGPEASCVKLGRVVATGEVPRRDDADARFKAHKLDFKSEIPADLWPRLAPFVRAVALSYVAAGCPRLRDDDACPASADDVEVYSANARRDGNGWQISGEMSHRTGAWHARYSYTYPQTLQGDDAALIASILDDDLLPAWCRAGQGLCSTPAAPDAGPADGGTP